MILIFNIQVLLCYSSIQMVFVWCQSINPFLRYGNVNIWRKWPWRLHIVLFLVFGNPHLYPSGSPLNLSETHPWAIRTDSQKDMQTDSMINGKYVCIYNIDRDRYLIDCFGVYQTHKSYVHKIHKIQYIQWYMLYKTQLYNTIKPIKY